MKIILTIASLLVLTVHSYGQSIPRAYAVGADLSFMKQAEDKGFIFKENGEAKKGLDLFHEHGYGWIRLRLFHTPDKLPNNLAYTVALAREAKKKGYKFLLDYHYSDTWADPAKQFIPKAWEGKTHAELIKAVRDYTEATMKVFRDSAAWPDMVQVGNEISNGMMWPDGKLPENWKNLTDLLKAGIEGIDASVGKNKRPEIMIHIDKGGDRAFTKSYFDKLNSFGVKYDIIGQSYYPWWHGSLLDLRDCLNATAKEFKKPIIVVEAAYNWKPKEYVGKLAPFPESPDGQREFLDEVNRVVLSVPDNLGAGVFWWEPAVARGGSRSFFMENGDVLPVMTVFDRFVRK